ncbi:MAG: (Fe-S)-binding protein [Chloroflexi bacterium]|nr:(Fe-S)-binding protein [Chloroflexota bacterium]
MPLPIHDVLGVFSDNLRIRRYVVPLSPGKVDAWAKGLDIPFGGETVLYTGQMYQLMPAIDSMSQLMAKFENSSITRFFGVGRILNRIVNISWFMSGGNGKEQARYNGILRNIAALLKMAGVDFGYLHGKELYSGALVYDEGLDQVFAEHARRVYRVFKENGVKQVITVDPHTTNMLKSVYPKIIDGYDLITRSYLEVLAEKDLKCAKQLPLELVIHDSCVYARHENIVDEPRRLLKTAGSTIHLPELSGKLTQCCGGPLESLFPGKAHEVAQKRVAQLAGCGNSIVTMCPICMANLRRAANDTIEIKDISEHLVNGYCVID